jgi:hypothetical protein
MEQVNGLAPTQGLVWKHFQQALLAAGQYDRLLQEIARRPITPTDRYQMFLEQLSAHAARGDRVKAQAALEQALQVFTDPQAAPLRQVMRSGLEQVLYCGLKDVAGYLKVTEHVPNHSGFEPALLRGRLPEAAGRIGPDSDEQTTINRALLYLAALQAGDNKLADEQWPVLLALLARGSRQERQLGDMLAGRQLATTEGVRRLTIDPSRKRVLVAVAARRYPALAGELLPLARQLDFQRDATSLCLTMILDKKGG